MSNRKRKEFTRNAFLANYKRPPPLTDDELIEDLYKQIPIEHHGALVWAVDGATGPSFIVAFKETFDEPLPLLDAIRHVVKKFARPKGFSLKIADGFWLRSVFYEFKGAYVGPNPNSDKVAS